MLGKVAPADRVVIADLEAGIGTLTRMGAEDVDAVLVVVDATPKSIEVATRAAGLAREKSLGRVLVLANRVRGEDDLTTVRKAFPDDEVIPIPDDPAIAEADRYGVAVLDLSPDSPATSALVRCAEDLLESHVRPSAPEPPGVQPPR